MQINQKGIRTEIKDVKQRKPLYIKIYWQKYGPLSLPSYVVKSSVGKENVLMLSSLEPILGTTKDANCQKLGLHKLYHLTKGGTDIVEQRDPGNVCVHAWHCTGKFVESSFPGFKNQAKKCSCVGWSCTTAIAALKWWICSCCYSKKVYYVSKGSCWKRLI